MAISLLSNLSYLGEEYNFSRDAFATIAEMKAFDADYLPPMYLSYCEEDGKVYLYNDNNTEDATTGRWRVFGEGGEGAEGADEIYVGDTQPTDTNITMWIDTTNTKAVLKYRYGDEYKAIGGVSKLSDLTDVDLTSIKNNSVIKWNGTKWIATTIANEIIDDNTSAENKVYSSSKVNEIIDGLTLKVDEKPTYDSETGVITYKVGGVTNTTTNANIKFYYTVGGDNLIKKYETFFLDGVEYTHLLTDTVLSGVGTAEDIAYANTEHTAWTNVKKALDGIINKVYYVKPSITSFTATPSTTVYEVGQKVSSIAFAWTTNKDITTQTLTDCTLADVTVRSATYDTEISSNKSFSLSISDGENTDSKTFSVAFRNKIYYGGATIPDTYDSAFILGLAKSQFATTSKGSYAVSVGSGNYGFIAYPKSFGQISSVYIGGFETTVENCGDISFTNASGGVATYNIVRTGRSGLGSITMEVK